MSRLNSQMQAYITRVTATYLKDTCTIRRPSVIEGDYGDQETWVNDATSVPCRMLPFEQRDVAGTTGEQEQGRSRWRLIVGSTVTVEDGWQIIYAGDTFEFEQLHDVFTDQPYKEVIVVRQGS